MASLHDRSHACEWPDAKCLDRAEVELHDGYEAPSIYCRNHGLQMLARVETAEAQRRETRKAEALERYEREIAAIEKEETG